MPSMWEDGGLGGGFQLPSNITVPPGGFPTTNPMSGSGAMGPLSAEDQAIARQQLAGTGMTQAQQDQYMQQIMDWYNKPIATSWDQVEAGTHRFPQGVQLYPTTTYWDPVNQTTYQQNAPGPNGYFQSGGPGYYPPPAGANVQPYVPPTGTGTQPPAGLGITPNPALEGSIMAAPRTGARLSELQSGGYNPTNFIANRTGF